MDPIIFGKNTLDRIVGAEHHDGYVEIFRQKHDGSIETLFIESAYWMLCSYRPDNTWERLEGNLTYKYIKFFQTREEFIEMKKSTYRYKKDFFSIYNPIESGMSLTGFTFFKNMKPHEPTILAFDIESTGLKHDKDSKVLLIANTFRKNGKITRKLFAYDDYDNDKDFLDDWCKWVCDVNPSIMLGHNIFSYDLPYLQYCAHKAGTNLRLGRDKSHLIIEDYEKKFRVDGNRDLHYNDVRIYGRNFVDTMQLALKSDISRKYSSYGLKSIIDEENWTVEGRQFYDAASIKDNYKNPVEWKKIKAYAEQDGDDALKIYDEMIPPFFFMAQSISKPFQLTMQSASGSQLNSIMVRAYLQEGHSLPRADESGEFEGALSEGFAGIYANTEKFDVSSLYPSLMLTYNIYPQSKDPKKYFPHLLNYFTTERLSNKKLAKETNNIHYKHLEQSQKIFINSLYGFMGAPGLLFNDCKRASLVTAKGREVLNKAIQWTKDNNFTLCNLDTDSILFCKSDQTPFTKEERLHYLENLNSLYPNTIRFELDGNFEKIIIFKAKNYVLYDGKKIKYKGSAFRSPALEPALREFIHKVTESIIFDRKDFTETYIQYLRECFYVTDIKRWCSRKTISSKTLESERTNESKIRDAFDGTDYVEGDRIHTYTDINGKLKLKEYYNNDHDPFVLVDKLYKASERFSTVLPTDDLFIDYGLKKRRKDLIEMWQLPDIFKTLPKGWEDILMVSACNPHLIDFLSNIDWDTTLPTKENVFRAFQYFKPKGTKVIIIGQDPYPNRSDACGLAFSSQSGKIPPSLQNIFKELKEDMFPGRVILKSGDLEDWANQGILLFNSVLTVEEDKSASHARLGWEQFTTKVIQQIVNLDQPLVIIAWGQYAKDKLNDLQLHDKVKVIMGVHPSPLAGGAFFGGKYFSKTNEHLKKYGMEGISW